MQSKCFLFISILGVYPFFSCQIVVLNISVLLALTSHIPSKFILSVLNRTMQIICLMILKHLLKYDNILNNKVHKQFCDISFYFDFRLFEPLLPLLVIIGFFTPNIFSSIKNTTVHEF